MILYHRTTEKAARAILQQGFRDASGWYFIARRTTGVWLSDRPVDINEGAKGPVLLRVVLTINPASLRRYEWIEQFKGYREWQVPAALIRAHKRRIARAPWLS